jgi:hypothetical protein
MFVSRTSRLVSALAVVSAALAACAEASDGPSSTTPSALDASASVSSDASTSTPEAASTSKPAKDASAPLDAGSNVSSGSVLINEISGSGEWIELVSIGTQATDLSGYKIADRDQDTGEPKLEDAFTFPVGTILSPRVYVIVQGGGGDAGKPCPDGGQSYCFSARFGISNKNGETLFLLAPDDKVVGKVVYPKDGSSGDKSYSRLPSGDPAASFEAVGQTPGAANVK